VTVARCLQTLGVVPVVQGQPHDVAKGESLGLQQLSNLGVRAHSEWEVVAQGDVGRDDPLLPRSKILGHRLCDVPGQVVDEHGAFASQYAFASIRGVRTWPAEKASVS
jgi:hypothetical protein